MNRPVTLTIAALGGQGGGVVQEWMIDVAEAAGMRVQATSVPGVAQRTGATIYYLEFAARDAGVPVMALMPASGACDLVVASELVEAARMVQRGFVGAETTLVTSTHRAYTIDEKSHRADGRADSAALLAVVEEAAGRVVPFDMEAVAASAGSVISAAILGGIAASEVLPFDVALYEQAIERGGKGVDASLAAFRAAYAAAAAPRAAPLPEAVQAADDAPVDTRLASLPAPIAAVAAHALPRLVSYQDEAYVDEYLAHLAPFAAKDLDLGREMARGIALWMTFEDTIRVAELKTAPERLAPHVAEQRVVHVVEFMKPRLEEIAGSLPAGVGRWMLRSKLAATCLKPMTTGLKIRSTSLWGYALLRLMASLRRVRRSTLRFEEEMAEMHAWMQLVARLAERNLPLALAVAESQQLVSGYGDTHAEGLARYKAIAARAEALLDAENGAEQVRGLLADALQAEAA